MRLEAQAEVLPTADALPGRGPPLHTLAGLPLLYASTYFIPLVLPAGAYLQPSYNLLPIVVLPTLVAVLAGAALLYAAWAVAQRWTDRTGSIAAVAATALLSLIALQSILEAAGIHWRDRIPRGHDLAVTQQAVRFVTASLVFAALWLGRRFLPQVIRVLSSLGLAFGAIAVFHLLALWSATERRPPSVAPRLSASASIRSHSVAALPGYPVLTAHRRVVWVIFDETDFERLYGNPGKSPGNLKNFERLREVAVFADQANSPACATLYSIPSLLTGVPTVGISIDSGARLALRQPTGADVPFEEDRSIFGALAEHRMGASVLGFYHPYCKLFRLERCDSAAWPNSGGLSDAIWSNVPLSIAQRLGHSDGWGDITRDALTLLPQYLAREDALTFIHLNVPHLPAVFVDEKLHLAPSPDPLIEYSRNLVLTDRILGAIVNQLTTQRATREVLLIVSTDHWLRNRWYRADAPEVSRAIPFIVWKVGATQGVVLSQPVSSVHTAAMVLDYLSGEITSQADIAAWWARQPVYPAYIGPTT